MDRLAITVLTFVLVVFSQTGLASDRKTEVLGVLFYADWCGSCKVLDPVIQKARGKSNLDAEPILFVKLDLTDETRRNQSELMAEVLGIQDFYKENGGATGFMLLVDAETKKVITRLTKNMDAKKITKQIKGAISKASS